MLITGKSAEPTATAVAEDEHGKPSPRRRPRSRRRDTGARRPKSTAIQSPTAEAPGSPLDAGAPRAVGGEGAGESPEESGVALEIALAYCSRERGSRGNQQWPASALVVRSMGT